jgi:hypothetical protein
VARGLKPRPMREATSPRRASGKALLPLLNPVHKALQAESLAWADLPGSRILPVDVSAVLYGYSDARTEAY